NHIDNQGIGSFHLTHLAGDQNPRLMMMKGTLAAWYGITKPVALLDWICDRISDTIPPTGCCHWAARIQRGKGGAIMQTFALVGAAGYIAPRHMRAIKAIGGELKVAFDPNDSVGVIDSYFPDTSFFVEFERFDRHIDKMRRRGEKIDFVSICSPNYLHDAHCRFALRSNINAICEKPLVLNPWNIDGLAEIEGETGRRISTILQLRLHPAIQALKSKVDASTKNRFDVELTYITSRGLWYHQSWKGDEEKSGGIATNIGVHFFDALVHIFGPAST